MQKGKQRHIKIHLFDNLAWVLFFPTVVHSFCLACHLNNVGEHSGEFTTLLPIKWSFTKFWLCIMDLIDFSIYRNVWYIWLLLIKWVIKVYCICLKVLLYLSQIQDGWVVLEKKAVSLLLYSIINLYVSFGAHLENLLLKTLIKCVILLRQ